MPLSANQLRTQIEAALERRIPAALTPKPQQVREVTPTGIASLDRLLGGGLPVGAISEVVGAECSGRTTLAFQVVAQKTSAGLVCAWIDASDVLDPESAAANGVELSRLLWVRCCDPQKKSQVSLQQQNQNEKRSSRLANVPVTAATRPTQGGGSPHPRNEVRGLDTAVENMMQRKNDFVRDKRIGTPGVPNIPLGRDSNSHQQAQKYWIQNKERVEQIPYDRLPARRGQRSEHHENYEHHEQNEHHGMSYSEPQPESKLLAQRYEVAPFVTERPKKIKQKLWSRLDQALKATDLLLHAGGFSVIVLDLGSILPEGVSRIPLASWYRFRAAAERSRSSLLVVSKYDSAKSSASVVLHMNDAEVGAGGARIFQGMRLRAELQRQRFAPEGARIGSMRKPQQRDDGASWLSRTSWTGIA